MHGPIIDWKARVVIVATNQENWKWDIVQKYLKKLDIKSKKKELKMSERKEVEEKETVFKINGS